MPPWERECPDKGKEDPIRIGLKKTPRARKGRGAGAVWEKDQQRGTGEKGEKGPTREEKENGHFGT